MFSVLKSPCTLASQPKRVCVGGVAHQRHPPPGFYLLVLLLLLLLLLQRIKLNEISKGAKRRTTAKQAAQHRQKLGGWNEIEGVGMGGTERGCCFS